MYSSRVLCVRVYIWHRVGDANIQISRQSRDERENNFNGRGWAKAKDQVANFFWLASFARLSTSCVWQAVVIAGKYGGAGIGPTALVRQEREPPERAADPRERNGHRESPDRAGTLFLREWGREREHRQRDMLGKGNK